jgi:hypothetical protein
MKSIRTVTLSLLLLVLVGCAVPIPVNHVSRDAGPVPKMGHVGGNFNLVRKNFVTAFVLTNVDTKVEYLLPFANHGGFKESTSQSNIITVPLGRYKITHWIVYNGYSGPSTTGAEFRKPVNDSRLTEIFELKENELMFVGKFYGDNPQIVYFSESELRASWRLERIPMEAVRFYLNSDYPKFSSFKVVCMTCSSN